jgi:tetratricopeptide (TPR) repeat protein
VLIATFEYGQADLWLTRQVEAIARERGDERLLSQALAEMAELLEEPRERVSVELRTAEIGGGVRSPSAAANRLARALAIDPKHPTVAEALGALRERAGDANGAADAYAEAAKRARSDARKAELNYHAGRLYEERVRDPERACALYFEAARADASAHDVLGRLERLLPVHGDARRLADIVATYVSRGGERGHLVSLHLMHARLRRALGDAASAKKSLRTVTTFEPERTDAFELLAAICLESNDPRGAAEAYQKIVVTSRDQEALRRAYLALADLFAASKDTRRAKEALRKLIEIFPDDSEAKQRLALMEATR